MDIKSWIKAKDDECKSGLGASHFLISKAIAENNNDAIKYLIKHQHPIYTCDLSLCIKKNNHECLYILLNHLKPSGKVLRDLINEATGEEEKIVTSILYDYMDTDPSPGSDLDSDWEYHEDVKYPPQ